MRKDRSESGQDIGPFRGAAVKAAGFRLFGDVCVALPPSAIVCSACGGMVTLLLAFVLWIVEVPTRIAATGMLMPQGGYVDVVAAEPGQVSIVHVRESEFVQEGDVLLEVVPDGKDSNRSLSSAAELQSLQVEYNLLDLILERQRAVFHERQGSLSAEFKAARQRLELAEQRVATISGILSVLDERVSRMKLLAESGHIAYQALEREELALLEARNSVGESGAVVSAARADLARLNSREREYEQELRLAVAEHRLRKQSVMREIERREFLAVQTVVAPRSGMIAWLPARNGMPVRNGQSLARIVAKDGAPEAWMYVSSANARRINPGETVELQFDAWPAAEFGTQSATVLSVSSFVLGPAEVPVPLAINGPVFELRASVSVSEFAEHGPGPGATFKAQIVSRRDRLYRWLTKRLRDSISTDHA